MTLLNSSPHKNKLSPFVAVHISPETRLCIAAIKKNKEKLEATFSDHPSVLSNACPSCIPVDGTTQAVNCALINSNPEIS